MKPQIHFLRPSAQGACSDELRLVRVLTETRTSGKRDLIALRSGKIRHRLFYDDLVLNLIWWDEAPERTHNPSELTDESRLPAAIQQLHRARNKS